MPSFKDAQEAKCLGSFVSPLHLECFALAVPPQRTVTVVMEWKEATLTCAQRLDSRAEEQWNTAFVT
jgi:hypothetical protein